MNLAIASKKDFKLFWSIKRANQYLEYAQTELREERCKKIIVGRIMQLGGGFDRVIMGCEMFIHNVCDKSLDYYDFNPEIKSALENNEKNK